MNWITAAKKIGIKVQKIFKSLVKNGNGNDDHSAFYKELKRLNKKKKR